MRPEGLLVVGFLVALAVGGGSLALWAGEFVRAAMLASGQGVAAPAARRVAQIVQEAILVSGIGAVLLAVGFAALLRRLLLLPLREVRAAAEAMAHGDLSRRAVLPRDGEVGKLASTLNALSDSLQRRLRGLEEERVETLALVDAMSEGVLALNPDGTLRRANPAARRMFKLPPSVRGIPPEAIARRPAFLALVEAALAGGPLAPSELRYDEHHLLATAQPLESGGAVLVFLDVSELRRLEDVRRDFVANASHELKTPLTAIRGYSETLAQEDLPPELRRRFAATVRDNAERLQRIVDDLLDLSRIESGGYRVEPVPTELAAVAREAWDACGASADEPHFGLAIPEDARTVYADRSALRQILTNLFANAIRHTPVGGQIELRARRRGDWVRVEVLDTGSGIAGVHLPRIFERFYRVDASRARGGGGTGLGLAIVRHLVERHGGTVEAESQLGQGTTVRFTLPAVEPASG